MNWRTALIVVLIACAWCWARSAARRKANRILLGRSKRWIATSLGEPLTVALSTDTWYYPLDAERGRALAIQFDRDVATGIQVIGPGSF